MALAWLYAKKTVTAPIVGATNASHLEDAVAAVDVKLTPEEIAALEEPYTPDPVVGFRQGRPGDYAREYQRQGVPTRYWRWTPAAL